MGFGENGLVPGYRPELHYSKTKLNPFDKECSKRLYVIVAKSGRLMRRPNLNRWAYFFHEIFIKTDFDRERITRVIDWYALNWKSKYTPSVYSAQMFYEKFYQIEDAMKRNYQEDLPVVSKQALRLFKQIKQWGWPKNFSSKLSTTIQQSLDAFKQFQEMLLNEVQPKSLVTYICDHHCIEPSAFLFEWFAQEFKRVQNWSDWSGEPRSIMFRVDSPRFERMFLEWCEEYTLDRSIHQRALRIIQA